MSNAPLLSIVIATFNAEKLLEKTLASLETNTEIAFEILVADGGSSDNTLEIIKKYNRLIYWSVSEPDHGIFDAWNKAVKMTRAPWIAFLGAGDVYLPGALSIYAEAAQSNPTAHYIHAKLWQVYEDGRRMREQGKRWQWSDFKHRMTTTHVGNWHAKAAFDMYGLFNAEYKIVGDYEWLLRIGSNLRTFFIDRQLVEMLVGGSSDRNWGVLSETAKAKRRTANQNFVVIAIDLLEATLRKIVGRWVYPR
jgi:glycosyltransferase involved in cell wall biosynthesis